MKSGVGSGRPPFRDLRSQYHARERAFPRASMAAALGYAVFRTLQSFPE
jgi:hypothetical protein